MAKRVLLRCTNKRKRIFDKVSIGESQYSTSTSYLTIKAELNYVLASIGSRKRGHR